MARQYAWDDEPDDEEAHDTDDLLALPAPTEARLRALEQAVASRTRRLREAAQRRAEEKRHAARQAMLDGAHPLEAYRAAMARIDGELAAELADVPPPPNRGELREKGAAVIAEALARFYEREVDLLEAAFARWQPACAGSEEETRA
jgi:multidrug efflux pump subunit AcrA (membrane-fusion protein)